MTVADRKRLAAGQMVPVLGEGAVGTGISSAWIEWRPVVEWRQQAEIEAPDLMGMFSIVMITPEDLVQADPDDAPMTEQDIERFMEWLRSDSLDWEGVERRDAWRA
jgi:hypothetical protein